MSDHPDRRMTGPDRRAPASDRACTCVGWAVPNSGPLPHAPGCPVWADNPTPPLAHPELLALSSRAREEHPEFAHATALQIQRLIDEVLRHRARPDGLVLPGWMCPRPHCRAFNGEDLGVLFECRACGASRPDARTSEPSAAGTPPASTADETGSLAGRGSAESAVLSPSDVSVKMKSYRVLVPCGACGASGDTPRRTYHVADRVACDDGVACLARQDDRHMEQTPPPRYATEEEMFEAGPSPADMARAHAEDVRRRAEQSSPRASCASIEVHRNTGCFRDTCDFSKGRASPPSPAPFRFQCGTCKAPLELRIEGVPSGVQYTVEAEWTEIPTADVSPGPRPDQPLACMVDGALIAIQTGEGLSRAATFARVVRDLEHVRDELRMAESPRAPLTHLLDLARAMEPDALRVLTMIAERLTAGRRAYGDLVIADDKRNFRAETAEELVDASVYLAMQCIRSSGKGQR